MALTDNPLAPGRIRPGIVNNVTVWKNDRSSRKVSDRVITVDSETELRRELDALKRSIGNIAADRSSLLKVDNSALEIRVNHYENTDVVTWNMQIQLAELTDTTFSAPIISVNTLVSGANCYYRLDGGGNDGSIMPFPTEGMTTRRSAARRVDMFYWAATVIYIPTAIELAKMVKGKKYFLRARQTPDRTTWGSWLTTIIEV